MPAPGIAFTVSRPAAPPASTRADIALFAGLVARRQGVLAASLLGSLEADAPAAAAGGFLDERLLGVPVRVDSWSDFDRLFDWTARASVPGAADRVPSALGLAVRQFFLQGGASAYVVRCGDPLPGAEPDASADDFRKVRDNALFGKAAPDDDRIPILPGLRGKSLPADPLDPASWLGAAAIFAVMDAAMLVLPDLIDLAADGLLDRAKIQQRSNAIQVERSRIQADLADTGAQLDIGVQRLTECLDMAADAVQLYREAPDDTRRLLNQSFFHRFYLNDDGHHPSVTRDVLKPPYDEITEAAWVYQRQKQLTLGNRSGGKQPIPAGIGHTNQNRLDLPIRPVEENLQALGASASVHPEYGRR